MDDPQQAEQAEAIGEEYDQPCYCGSGQPHHLCHGEVPEATEDEPVENNIVTEM